MSPVTVECHILDDRSIAMGTALMAVCGCKGTRTPVWRFSLGDCFLGPCVACRVVPHQSLSVKNETGGHVPRRFLVLVTVHRYSGFTKPPTQISLVLGAKPITANTETPASQPSESPAHTHTMSNR